MTSQPDFLACACAMMCMAGGDEGGNAGRSTGTDGSRPREITDDYRGLSVLFRNLVRF